MQEVRWGFYPLVAADETARMWLQLQANLQLAPTTIDAYGRSLNDYLAFCANHHITPEQLSREHIALYVQDLSTRPNPKAKSAPASTAPPGLSNSTIQQRLTVARLYHDYLVEKQLRTDHPISRGQYVPGRAFGGARPRALVPSYHKLPWIPADSEWLTILQTLREEPLRNQLMFLVAYDGALRREELVTLEIRDIDVAYRQIRVRAECAKNGAERIVNYGSVTSRLCEAYLHQRRTLSSHPGPLFLSESHRNRAQPLSLVMWSKIVQKIARRAGVPRLTTHTPRHLRLTHLARAHLDLHAIARYAGHRSIQTTMLYIHLSGVELTEAVQRSLRTFERWISLAFEEEHL